MRGDFPREAHGWFEPSGYLLRTAPIVCMMQVIRGDPDGGPQFRQSSMIWRHVGMFLEEEEMCHA